MRVSRSGESGESIYPSKIGIEIGRWLQGAYPSALKYQSFPKSMVCTQVTNDHHDRCGVHWWSGWSLV